MVRMIGLISNWSGLHLKKQGKIKIFDYVKEQYHFLILENHTM